MDSHRRCRLARPAARTQISLDTLLVDLTSGDDLRAEAALHRLVALGAKAQPALRELATSADAEKRWWAISTLAQMEDVDVDILIAALKDESLEVQQSAALGLAQHPHPKAVPALLGLLPNSDGILRNLAMNAIVSLGADAVPELLNFLETHPEPDSARLSAVRALATIGDTRAIPALMAALEESALIAHWAEEGLVKLGLDMVYMKLE